MQFLERKHFPRFEKNYELPITNYGVLQNENNSQDLKRITNYELHGSFERKHFPGIKRITNYQLRITWFSRTKTIPKI
jgi:hypothetical protein